MTIYVVRIEGKGIDFLLVDRVGSLFGFLGFGRKSRCVGFFTTRYVESDSETNAVQLAFKRVTEELLGKGVISTGNLNSLNLRVDNVATTTTQPPKPLDEGFSFYQAQ
jgi:hypothetical protein